MVIKDDFEINDGISGLWICAEQGENQNILHIKHMWSSLWIIKM